MERCDYSQVKLTACPVCCSENLEDVFGYEKRYVLCDGTCEFYQQYSICRDCTFVFTADPLDDDSLRIYYESDSQERREFASADEKVHMQAQFDFLIWNGLDITDRSILEIGAGNGTFLDLLKSKGADKNRLFYDELSIGSKQILTQKKYKHISEEDKSKGVDLVVMNHTLEHLVNPINKLREIYQALSENGSLYIEVPDFTYDSENTDSVIFQHVNYFSESTLRVLLEKAGFVVVAIQNDFDGEYAACRKNVLRILAFKSNKNKLATNNLGVSHKGKKPITWSEHKEGFISREINRRGVYDVVDDFLSKELAQYGHEEMRVAFWTARSETIECLASISLNKYNIVAIFDRNKHHWKTRLFDIEIMDPNSLTSMKVTHIIIPNEGYENDIKRDLFQYGFKGKVMSWSDFKQS